MTHTLKRALLTLTILSLPFTLNMGERTDFTPPKPVFTPAEIAAFIPYPHQAITYGMEGQVLVRFKVKKDGAVEYAQIMTSTHPLFSEAVMQAVSKMKFTPAKNAQGEAITMYYTLPVTFTFNKR